jgi:hypothetical protein
VVKKLIGRLSFMPLRAYSISAVHPAAPDTVPFPVSDSPVDSATEKEASCLCLDGFVLHGNGLGNGVEPV